MPEFVYSRYEEDGFSGTFPTRERALAEGRATWPGDAIYTGIAVMAEADVHGWARRWIEQMQESEQSDCSAAEEWLNDVSVEQVADLDAELAKTLKQWLDRHCLTPTWFVVVELQRHEPDSFLCPCGASHDRGPVNGVDVYRCLRCGQTTCVR